MILAGRGGRAIRFPEAEVPMMGRVAQGVRGVKLKDGEAVVGLAVARREGGELCLVTERGWAKRVPLEELQPQGRGGMGTQLIAATKESGELAAAREVHPGEDLMALTAGGRPVRIKVESVPKTGRAGAAEKSVALTGNERVADVAYVAERELPESPDAEEPAAPVAAIDADTEETAEIADVARPPSSNGSAPPAADAGPPPAAAGDSELDLFG